MCDVSGGRMLCVEREGARVVDGRFEGVAKVVCWQAFLDGGRVVVCGEVFRTGD